MKYYQKKISKYLIFLICSFFTLMAHGQNEPKKKIKASINHEYITQQSPIQINYKIFPYGGSGNYEFRWRYKDEKFSSYSESDFFQISFNCLTEKRPEITMFCQIKDQQTGETFTTVLRHPVEFCMN